ncbi:hypothetical protein [Spirulina subsalsa]|uniref:hypothetical protein n=1 Tax=Spirulina subsalsa TaxID=54311 RepID=UPI0003138D59|nr:hypothetical protein [Spirulina subsalsa]
MKPIVTIALLLGLLSACGNEGGSNGVGQLPAGSRNDGNCPAPPASPVELTAVENVEFYADRFNFQIRDIQQDGQILRFQSSNYDFVYCNETWTVQRGTYQAPPPKTWEEQQAELEDPTYQSFEVNGQLYYYRAYLDPSPLANPNQLSQRVIFEIVPPGQDEPIVTTLYTVQQLRNANLGAELSDPREIHGIVYRDRPLWVVSAYKGEGFSGIATFITYDPEQETVIISQPPEIAGQVITDLKVSPDDTLWMTTQLSGEGNPFYPGMGLVSYQPPANSLQGGQVRSFHVRNSPLLGAIPTRIHMDGNTLWVGTGNGICQVNTQQVETAQGWDCWRFALMVEGDNRTIALHSHSQSENPSAEMTLNDPLEVLWWVPGGESVSDPGRYEVRYEPGFEATLREGRRFWGFDPEDFPPDYLYPLYWSGSEWHWNGDRFIRGFDAVSLNFFGGGPPAIRQDPDNYDFPPDLRAVRGDLTILDIQDETMNIRHHSAWIDDKQLSPYLTLLPVQQVENPQGDPLLP